MGCRHCLIHARLAFRMFHIVCWWFQDGGNDHCKHGVYPQDKGQTKDKVNKKQVRHVPEEKGHVL